MKRPLRALLLFGLWAALGWGLPALAAPERVALVIGNGAYRSLPPLANPPNDATDVARILRRLGFDVVEGRDLDRTGMEESIRSFAAKMKGAKLTTLFYAGHGLQVDGRNYLVPVDAKIARAADLTTDAVGLDFVMSQMDAESRVNIVVLDACRDNPFAASTDAALATRKASLGTGLATVQGAIDTLVVFSTQPDNVALDGQGRNSPFTEALLKHLGDAGVEVGGVMRRVRTRVVEATNRKQIPWDHSSLRTDVVLAPGAPAGPAGPAPAGPPSPSAPTAGAPPPPAAGTGPSGPTPGVPPAETPRALSETEALVAECDRLAADPFDTNKPANVRGVQRAIISRSAVQICARALVADQTNGRIHFELGRALYAAKDYAKANALFESAIELGYGPAYAELGRQYFFGFGLRQSYEKARELFEKGAAAGDPSAIKNIGFMYHQGYGVKADIGRAIGYYQLAPNHPTVMNNMAVLYEAGTGVPKDVGRAVRMWEQAVLGGDEVAHRNLADMYAGGRGVPRDLAKAKLLYGRAAVLGDAAAAQAFTRLQQSR